MDNVRIFLYEFDFTGVGPGFLVGGGANPPGGGASIQICQISEKLHEIKKIFGPSPWIRHCLRI